MRKTSGTIFFVGLALASSVSAAPLPHASTAQAADSSSTQAPESATDVAYQQALEHLLPVTPSQLRAYKHRLDATRQAIQPATPPQLITRTLHLSTDPGGEVPVITIAPGYVVALTVVDATGAPWPIADLSVGNPKWFDVEVPKTSAANQVVISALGTHLASNLTLSLRNSATPIAIEVRTNPKVSDAVVVARIEQRGPNATQHQIESPQAVGSAPALTAFLNYTPPAGAVKMRVSLPGVDLWRFHSNYFMRTRFAALWPAWDASTSLDGITVYRLPLVQSLLVSHRGSPIRVRVEGPATAPATARANATAGD